ncbi:MAG: ChaN family lipoprotein [Desulfosalsimonas sp.]
MDRKSIIFSPARPGFGLPAVFLVCALLAAAAGCSSLPHRTGNDTSPSGSGFTPGDIISVEQGKPVSFNEMIEDLLQARVVYAAESHASPRHHEMQLRILSALYTFSPDLAVGMEMFSRPYQELLDLWSAGKLDREEFISRSHWYANWKYDYGLYEDILDFVRENSIPVYALNIAFHVPPKIAAGGIESLPAEDRARLPEKIDLGRKKHRNYVREMFEQHDFGSRPMKFEHFYQAQCVWDEVMAETIARHLGKGPIVIFAGKGHISNDFAIPERVHDRTGASYRTVIPVTPSEAGDTDNADYLWITDSPGAQPGPHSTP